MNENLSIREEDRCAFDRLWHATKGIDRGEYEPPWEDWKREEEENRKAWQIEQQRRRTEGQNFALEAERQLHDPRYISRHTNRLLQRASRGLRYFRITLSRDGLVHTPTRKDKRRMKKNLRKRARQLEILTQRGETSAPGQGDNEDRGFNDSGRCYVARAKVSTIGKPSPCP